MSLEELRRQYTMSGLAESDMPTDPIDLFSVWMQSALDNAPDEWVEPYAMTLATGDKNGEVSARVVLLRGFDEAGFVFYTNYDSLKGQQIESNSNVALVFYWGYLERQVRVVGQVHKIDRERSETYFHKRPRGSQVGASISKQSSVISGREKLEAAARHFENQTGDSPIPLPEFWGGYCVAPRQIEFWQGRQNRLHDRLAYQKAENSWKLVRLSP